jgi:protein involved in polysaccharide export with SLBB domain
MPSLFRLCLLRSGVLLVILTVMACSPVTAEQTVASDSSVSAAASGYRLGSGDQVRITVYGQPELTGEYAIDGTGTLSFPLIGQVEAGGLGAGDLEKALIARLHPNYLKNPSISVEVMTYRPFYIVGEVRTPGSYSYVSGMTVLNAVALAGGFTYRAREGDFYVMRQNADGRKGRLTAAPDSPVLPGDVITVRERYF